MQSQPFFDTFNQAFALRTSDVDRSVALFHESFAASGSTHTDSLIHAALALRDAGRTDDARKELAAALALSIEGHAKLRFELGLIEYVNGRHEAALQALRATPRTEWDDNSKVIECAALLAIGRVDEAGRRLDRLNDGANLEFSNSYFSDLFATLLAKLSRTLATPLDHNRLAHLFDNPDLPILQQEPVLRSLAERMSAPSSIASAMNASPPVLRATHSANVWMLGRKLAFNKLRREALVAMGHDYLKWLRERGLRVHPSALKSLIKGSPDFECANPNLVSEMMIEDIDDQPAEEQVVASELSIRARQQGVLAPRIGRLGTTFYRQFSPLSNIPLTQRRGVIPTRQARVLCLFFGQCRDPGVALPRMRDEVLNIGFAHVDFAISTWSKAGHHLPPHRSWLRPMLDEQLVRMVESQALPGEASVARWSDELPVAAIYESFPLIRELFASGEPMSDSLAAANIPLSLLLDEAEFDRQYDRLLDRVKATPVRDWLAYIRNASKMWHCIGSGIGMIDRSPPARTPDFLFLCRPDLKMNGDLRGPFPTELATDTAYTDMDPACFSVGMGGLGDRFMILPYDMRHLLQIPQRLMSEQEIFSTATAHQEVQRLSGHQLIESIFVQSGIKFNLYSLQFAYELHRKRISMDEYKAALQAGTHASAQPG